MTKEDHEVDLGQEATAMATEDPFVSSVAEAMPVAADLDSQPLNDLGVSVMDQDVLERNVAAQVWAVMLMD